MLRKKRKCSKVDSYTGSKKPCREEGSYLGLNIEKNYYH